MDTKKRARLVCERLAVRYPRLTPNLDARTPWELLAATMLAAQCTDKRVNMITPALFARWPGPLEMADADVSEVEEYIRSTGFFHNKANNLIAAAARIRDIYGGDVPRTMTDLLTLNGVARKTANVVLWGAYGINEGIAVDTHVGRIALRLALTEHKDPVRAEKDLLPLFPRKEWGNLNHRLVLFGREVCDARKPACAACEMNDFCPFAQDALKPALSPAQSPGQTT